MPAAKTHHQALTDHTMTLDNGCVVWTGHIDRNGYGKVNRRSARIYTAHTLAYVIAFGPVPDGCEIDHLCKNRACCNPAHLEAVPHAVNIGRGDYKSNHRNGRKTHCKRGHEFTSENTRIYVLRGVRIRKCRACRKERQGHRQNVVETKEVA